MTGKISGSDGESQREKVPCPGRRIEIATNNLLVNGGAGTSRVRPVGVAIEDDVDASSCAFECVTYLGADKFHRGIPRIPERSLPERRERLDRRGPRQRSPTARSFLKAAPIVCLDVILYFLQPGEARLLLWALFLDRLSDIQNHPPIYIDCNKALDRRCRADLPSNSEGRPRETSSEVPTRRP